MSAVPERAATSSRGAGGFTLLELIISIGILTVGLLGIINMQMQSAIGNSGARNITAGVNLARSHLEKARRIQEYHRDDKHSAVTVGSILLDPDGPGDLGNWTSPDGTAPATLREDGSEGGIYHLSWNVADDTPCADVKTVRVRVGWHEGVRYHYVDLETQIALKNLENYQ